MADVSKIAWTRSTHNEWIGCTKIGPGCDHCYASVSTPARSLQVAWGPNQPRYRTSEANRRKPLRWNELARQEQETGILTPGHDWHTPGFWPVFCSSLSDVFDNEVDPEWRADLFLLMERTPHLTWLVLTKRIGNVRGMLPTLWTGTLGRGIPPNVWLGITVVNQEEADRDIPKLLAVPAAKRFVSYEPALGPVDWKDYWLRASPSAAFQDGRVKPDMPEWTRIGAYALDWIIVGGESDQLGMKARPFDIEWARSTVRQCKEAGVPVFVKQLGDLPYEGGPYGAWETTRLLHLDARAGADPAEWPEDLRVRQFPAEAA